MYLSTYSIKIKTVLIRFYHLQICSTSVLRIKLKVEITGDFDPSC